MSSKMLLHLTTALSSALSKAGANCCATATIDEISRCDKSDYQTLLDFLLERMATYGVQWRPPADMDLSQLTCEASAFDILKAEIDTKALKAKN